MGRCSPGICDSKSVGVRHSLAVGLFAEEKESEYACEARPTIPLGLAHLFLLQCWMKTDAACQFQ